MDEVESLSHTKWECKYHVVFIPKYRRRALYEELRQHLGEVFRQLARQKESKIEEGHLLPDHVHMMIRCHRSMQFCRWLGISRVRARSTWHGCMVRGSEISRGSIFGPAAISFRQWDGMKR
jgi:putative transposase